MTKLANIVGLKLANVARLMLANVVGLKLAYIARTICGYVSKYWGLISWYFFDLLLASARRKRELRPFSFPVTAHGPKGRDGFRASEVFVGQHEVRVVYVQKHNLHIAKQKSGVIPKRAVKAQK